MGNNEDQGEGKTEGQLLSEKLFVNKKNCWDGASPEDNEAITLLGEEYKQFLDRGKTEREFTALTAAALEKAGFRDIDSLLSQGGVLPPGTKVYQNNRGKSLVFAVIGKKPLTDGVNIIGGHVDSPRIDLKTNPIYEEAEFVFLDTQYYGGIKNYQWTTIPLSLHGVLIREDGQKVEIRIGEEPGDPVFTITDLLPHLAREQMQKKAVEVVPGEDLNILAGSKPFKDTKAKDKVKLNFLRLLNEQYGLIEQDFAGAELELVPAFNARDLGLDRSMIGAYGHDDRSCAFAAIKAALEIARAADAGNPPDKTSIGLLTDKEEIGSVGNTGAQSRLFENFFAYLLSGNTDSYSEITLRRALSRSAMLSADVNCAFDPNYDSVYEKKNASYFGKGVVLTKYTGSGGKGGGSDANAEFCGKIQGILNKRNIQWQYGDLGKVDKGGGNTIAKYVAHLGVEVLDCGIPVLSMHSPFEVISKIDLRTTVQAFTAFYQEA
ncbi:M18 family aminopeptidase [Spirochaetia bacterium]|nr:M18 family aminopeptidase [Spirochaetia bacterium]